MDSVALADDSSWLPAWKLFTARPPPHTHTYFRESQLVDQVVVKKEEVVENERVWCVCVKVRTNTVQTWKHTHSHKQLGIPDQHLTTASINTWLSDGKAVPNC